MQDAVCEKLTTPLLLPIKEGITWIGRLFNAQKLQKIQGLHFKINRPQLVC